jgi:glycosidase
VDVDGRRVEVPTPFPSPQDWRDRWIYFLMVDRFDNPGAPPAEMPFDVRTGRFQGGTLEGVRRRLGYLQDLGVGAVWLTPVLKNAPYRNTYYGYAIQDFLQLDPRFAADPADPDAEMQRLVDEAHARGMYVIFDVVLNHTGDVFAYLTQSGFSDTADFSAARRGVRWRMRDGRPNPAWAEAPADQDPDLHPDAAVWPRELRSNRVFRQQGKGGEHAGDFESLKELVTAFGDVRTALIRIHQYLIARYDVDGFRIDTLKYVEEDFARIFGNAMREFALGIGKKNFFTFGEVYDDEEKIARFIGRRAMEPGDLTGVDAALDFPLFYQLPAMAKGLGVRPADVARVFERRKEVQRGVISSHGEVSRYFVTFLDNHDQKDRFHYSDPAQPGRFDSQTTLGLACLYTLQGIPCLYYGTEQGLSGRGGSDEAVREALWGKPGAFDPAHPFYAAVRSLSELRASIPALRYGRQYFRPLSGDGSTFGLSEQSPGVLAFSRILHDQEVVVVANTHTASGVSLLVIVDASLNPPGEPFAVLFSNQPGAAAPGAVEERRNVTVHEVDGSVGRGPLHAVRVSLRPMEVQIVARRRA